MIEKKVRRFYCDYCHKGFFARNSAARHESSCIRNPERTCPTCCLHVDGKTALKPAKSMAELVQILKEKGVKECQSAADGCPTCTLAAIVQSRPKKMNFDPDDWIDFDYKKELADYLSNG